MKNEIANWALEFNVERSEANNFADNAAEVPNKRAFPGQDFIRCKDHGTDLRVALIVANIPSFRLLRDYLRSMLVVACRLEAKISNRMKDRILERLRLGCVLLASEEHLWTSLVRRANDSG